MPKTLLAVAILTLFLTGCTSEGDSQALNSGRTDVSKIQENFRGDILDDYLDTGQDELIIAKAPSPKINENNKVDLNPKVSAKDTVKKESGTNPKVSAKDTVNKESEVSPELKAWRTLIGKEFDAIQSNQLDLLCDFFYEGLVDKSSSFAKLMVGITQQLESQGTTVYSITDVQMREDNRKTIEFPTAQYSSSLFVCSSKVTFELPIGGYSAPIDSTLSLIYYLSDGQKKLTFNFKAKS
jgi:hypothetical protein